MTTAGLYGTVTEIDGDEILLEIADGVRVRYVAAAVAKVVTPGTPTEPEASSIEDDTPSA
jgi:preprotein translocase subunit YajC